MLCPRIEINRALELPRRIDVVLRIDRLRHPMTGERATVTEYEPPLLFDLKEDRSETTNIAAEHPEIVTRMVAEAEEIKLDILSDYSDN